MFIRLPIVILSVSLVACIDGAETRNPTDSAEIQADPIIPVASVVTPTGEVSSDSSTVADSDTTVDSETTENTDVDSTPVVIVDPEATSTTDDTTDDTTPNLEVTAPPATNPIAIPMPLTWYQELLGLDGVEGSWYCGSILDSQITENNNPANWEDALIVDWTLPVNEMRFHNDRTIASGPILGTNIFGTYWYQSSSNGNTVTIQWSRGGYIEFSFNEQRGDQMMGGGIFCSRDFPEFL